MTTRKLSHKKQGGVDGKDNPWHQIPISESMKQTLAAKSKV